MDPDRIDTLSRWLATKSTRRQSFKLLGGSALGAVIAAIGIEGTGAIVRRPVGSICRQASDCASGICGVPDRTGRRRCLCGTPADCLQPRPGDLCRTATCSPAGICGFAPANIGGTCDDGNPCTLNDICQPNGTCAGTPKACPASDQCHLPGTCDPVTGLCSNPAQPNGTPCDDGNACTQPDTCQAGICAGGPPIDCDDGLACTEDSCDPGTGACANVPVSPGTPCNQNGGTVCDGFGQCVECLTAGDCPGLDTECQTRTCVAGFCGVFFAPAGTPLSAQISGDCRRTVCDGQGGTFSIPDNTDLPPDDMNECTVSVCIDGYPAYQSTPRGTPCTQGGVVCDGQGVCVPSISTCGDGLLNGDETGVDCGGSCPPCDLGLGCAQDADCQSGLCCGGVCSDPSSVSTCGNCQQICPPDFACLDGNCICPAPRSLCGSDCIDLATNDANCGYCGRNCDRFMSTAWCQDGACCGTVGGETICCGIVGAPNVCTRQEWYDCGKFLPPCVRTVTYPCCMSG